MFIEKKILANGQIIAVPIYAANASPALVIQHPQSVLPRQCRLLIYRRHCRVVIDNNGTLEETLTQTEEALRREAYE